MQRLVTGLFGAAFVLCLAACSTAIVQLRLADQPSAYRFGHAEFSDSAAGLWMRGSFLEAANQRYFFHIHFTNTTASTIELYPEKFSLLSTETFRKVQYGADYPRRMWALNPERAIIDAKRSQIREQNAADVTLVLGAVAATAELVGNIADATDRKLSNEQRYGRAAVRGGLTASLVATRNWSLADAASYADQKAYYERTLLRRHTLFPGETVSGTVIIGRLSHARLLTLEYPHDTLMLKAHFEQGSI